ncbi:MAG: hypothetical protein WCA22_20650 [Candidatus Binatus sp.]
MLDAILWRFVILTLKKSIRRSATLRQEQCFGSCGSKRRTDRDELSGEILATAKIKMLQIFSGRTSFVSVTAMPILGQLCTNMSGVEVLNKHT